MSQRTKMQQEAATQEIASSRPPERTHEMSHGSWAGLRAHGCPPLKALEQEPGDAVLMIFEEEHRRTRIILPSGRMVGGSITPRDRAALKAWKRIEKGRRQDAGLIGPQAWYLRHQVAWPNIAHVDPNFTLEDAARAGATRSERLLPGQVVARGAEISSEMKRQVYWLLDQHDRLIEAAPKAEQALPTGELMGQVDAARVSLGAALHAWEGELQLAWAEVVTRERLLVVQELEGITQLAQRDRAERKAPLRTVTALEELLAFERGSAAEFCNAAKLAAKFSQRSDEGALAAQRTRWSGLSQAFSDAITRLALLDPGLPRPAIATTGAADPALQHRLVAGSLLQLAKQLSEDSERLGNQCGPEHPHLHSKAELAAMRKEAKKKGSKPAREADQHSLRSELDDLEKELRQDAKNLAEQELIDAWRASSLASWIGEEGRHEYSWRWIMPSAKPQAAALLAAGEPFFTNPGSTLLHGVHPGQEGGAIPAMARRIRLGSYLDLGIDAASAAALAARPDANDTLHIGDGSMLKQASLICRVLLKEGLEVLLSSPRARRSHGLGSLHLASQGVSDLWSELREAEQQLRRQHPQGSGQQRSSGHDRHIVRAFRNALEQGEKLPGKEQEQLVLQAWIEACREHPEAGLPARALSAHDAGMLTAELVQQDAPQQPQEPATPELREMRALFGADAGAAPAPGERKLQVALEQDLVEIAEALQAEPLKLSGMGHFGHMPTPYSTIKHLMKRSEGPALTFGMLSATEGGKLRARVIYAGGAGGLRSQLEGVRKHAAEPAASLDRHAAWQLSKRLGKVTLRSRERDGIT